MDTTAWIELVILVVALVLAALAASAETSMTSISRVRLKRLVEEKNRRAILVERLQRDPNGYLSTILIANTVAIITATSAATLLAINFYGEHVAQWLVGLVLSLVVLMFCEISPKTLALQRSERVALALARPAAVATFVLRPLVRTMTFVTNRLIRLVGGKAAGQGALVTEGEVQKLVSVGGGERGDEEREAVE